MSYKSKYSGEEVEALLDKISDGGVGVKIVESLEELNALEAKVGDIATVAKEGLTQVKASDLFLSYDTDINWDKYTIIKSIERKREGYATSIGQLILYDSEVVITVLCNATTTYALLEKDGVETQLNGTELNQLLSQKEFRCINGSYLDIVDEYYNLYTQTPTIADAYIKGETWTRLLKEGDVVESESCSYIEDVIFYAADNVRGYTLTAEEKEKNIEAYNKQRQAYYDKTPLNRIVCVRGSVTLFMPVTYFIPGASTNGTTLNVIKSGGLDDFYINVSYDGSATYSEKKGLDEALSTTSQNPVQNKVVTAALNEKADKTSIPTKTSQLTNDSNFLTQHQDISHLASKAYVDEEISHLEGYAEEVANTAEADAKKYTDDKIATKQDTISDLAIIRSNASLGATAIQKVKTINGESLVGDGDVAVFTKALYDNLIEETVANEEVYAAAVNDLNTRLNTTNSTLNTTIETTESIITDINTLTTRVSSNEEVTATSYNELNERINNNYQEGVDTYATKVELNNEVVSINTAIVENEEVIAATLNDLLSQIEALRIRVEQLENA